MRPKNIPGTLYIALGIDGEVLAQYTDREQAYGHGRTLRKKIWVDGFIRGKWVRNRVTYVTVKE